jgi:predicted HicB family RNase H-like nuclease
MSLNATSYSMRVFWSEGDAGFIALCPELDVSAFGDTYEEAVRELQVVIRLTLEVYAADGDTPPAPASSPSHSGQLRVRLPRSLHARLAAEADEEGVSLNTLIVSRLSAAPRPARSPVARTITSTDQAKPDDTIHD